MDMAEKACTSIATYQRIEKGDGTVALATVFRVLAILDRLESFDKILVSDGGSGRIGFDAGQFAQTCSYQGRQV